MKTDIRRYLAADSAARRLKFNTETGKSSVHTDNQQDPPSERFGRHTRDPAPSDRFEEKTFGDIWQQTVKQNQLKLTTELSLDRHQQNSHYNIKQNKPP